MSQQMRKVGAKASARSKTVPFAQTLPVPIPAQPIQDVAVPTEPLAREQKNPAKGAREAAGRIVAAYSRSCAASSTPTPSRMDIAIMSTQAKNLILGGHDERDVLDEALAIVSEFTLNFGHRGMTQLQRRVQQKWADAAYREHEAVKFSPVAHDVLAAMGRGPSPAPAADQAVVDRRCGDRNCPRLALYGEQFCVSHLPRRVA